MRGKILFIDTETGGLNCATDALLTIAMVKWVDGEIVDQQELFVQPEGRTVSPDAIRVNGINMDEHVARAIPRDEAAERLAHWIKRAWNGSGKGWDKPILGGHNFPFDQGYLRTLYPEGKFDSTVSHRIVDTLAVLTTLEHAGMYPAFAGKLEKACAHFKVPFDVSVRHTSIGDIIATAKLYTAQLEMLSL